MAMAGVCPKCHSERVHRSHRRGALERLLAMAGVQTRRCHECNIRMVTLGQSILARRDVDRIVRKLSLAIVAAVALIAVVCFVLWLSQSREAAAAVLLPAAG